MLALSLPLVLAGFNLRLPLDPLATSLSYSGVLVCLAGIVWLFVSFPQPWGADVSVQRGIVGLYTVGLALMTGAGTVVPLVTPTPAGTDGGPEAGEASDAARAALADELAALHESNARFELYEDIAEAWRWRLRHRNGNVIADGGEGYASKQKAQQGLNSVRRNALGAPLFTVDPETVDDDVDRGMPVAMTEQSATVAVEPDSAASFEVVEDGQWRWRLRHEDGDVLARSPVSYTASRTARRGVNSVRQNAPVADYLRVDPAVFECYRDRGGDWRWRLVHRDGEVLAVCGRGYESRHAAREAADTVGGSIADADRDGGPAGDAVVERYEDAGGQWRWRLRDADDAVLAEIGHGYDDEGGAEAAIERVREHAPDAALLDVGLASFELAEVGAGEWRWRLRHRNGSVVAESGQAYDSRTAAVEAVEAVKRNAGDAGLPPERASVER
jgi:uncharacterized protein YegP (UPF0339 family)